MTVYSSFLQATQLVQFSGGITYNSNGFAVLPSYTIIYINSSMQPLSKAVINLMPEGTHYADWYQFITDYPVNVDNSDTSLGDYFIYNNNNVYKIMTANNFLPFTRLYSNHIEGQIVRDNRITFNGTSLSIPFPEVDSQYGSLFQLIAMVNSCFGTGAPNLSISACLWACQQELQPVFPYCTVTIESVENIDNTNWSGLTTSPLTYFTSNSKQLIVKFSFYSYDQVQAVSLLEQFKLNYVNFQLNSELLQWIGFVEESNQIENQLYEDRTIFNADCRMRFSWIVQQTSTSTSATNTIETVAFSLSIPPVS